jgi:hypothetical protein
MKGLFITIAFALCVSTTLSAQPPIQYSQADHDDVTVYQPANGVPGSVWGGSTGKGTKWCFPQDPYKGICIWRITDATVFSGGVAQVPDNDAENSVQTDDDQKDNIISAPNGSVRYVVVRSTGGNSAIIAFDSTQNTATKQGSTLSGEMMFDETNPGIIYARVENAQNNPTLIQKWASSDGWNTYTASTIYDFANCLPQGYQAKWESTWGTAVPTNMNIGTSHTWGTAFSTSPSQGTGYLALAYKEPVNGQGGGCASVDTFNDLAYGWNGVLLGPLDDGNGNPLPSFTMHDAGMTRNPRYFGITPANDCQNCALAYIWEIGTTHVRPCTVHCDGHAAQGFYDRADHKGNGSFLLLHSYADPNDNIVGPLLTDYPASGYDEHASWLNIPVNEGAGLPAEDQGVDVYPILITTTVVTSQPPPQTYSYWGQDEIIGISADLNDYGQNDFWRFGQTGNSGTSPFYTCQNAKGTVAELGDGIAFTSDMASDGSVAPLGTDSNGNPRCDVFWMELK